LFILIKYYINKIYLYFDNLNKDFIDKRKEKIKKEIDEELKEKEK